MHPRLRCPCSSSSTSSSRTDRAKPRCDALRDVTLTVAPGEIVAVMGPSGCGKSTLLHLAGALEMPSAGRVRVGGHELAEHVP